MTSVPEKPDVFGMAMRYYSVTNDRMQMRIGQLWKARYTAWTLLSATGAFFLHPDTTGHCQPLVVKLVVPLLGAIIAVYHCLFELRQESSIREERAIARGWLDQAEAILRSHALTSGLQPPDHSPLSAGKPPVAPLKLWRLSFFLLAAITLLLWL